MTAFNVYQNSAIAKHGHEVNSLGWDQACQRFPGVKAHLDCSLSGSRKWSPDFFSHYAHVLVVEASDLEDVFAVANGVPTECARVVDEFGSWHSLSVGDIVENNGIYHMVDPFGFREIQIQ